MPDSSDTSSYESFRQNAEGDYEFPDMSKRHPGGFCATLSFGRRSSNEELEQLVSDIKTHNLYIRKLEYYSVENNLFVFLRDEPPTPENADEYPHPESLSKALLFDENTESGVSISSAFIPDGDGIQVSQENVQGSAMNLSEVFAIAYAHNYTVEDISCYPTEDMEPGMLSVEFREPDEYPGEPKEPEPASELTAVEVHTVTEEGTTTEFKLDEPPELVEEEVAELAESEFGIKVEDHGIDVQ